MYQHDADEHEVIEEQLGAIDGSTDDDRDETLHELLLVVYPTKRSQDN